MDKDQSITSNDTYLSNFYINHYINVTTNGKEKKKRKKNYRIINVDRGNNERTSLSLSFPLFPSLPSIHHISSSDGNEV